MLISTRGRYALRVLAELARTAGTGYVPMKDIARRQGISLKYLERIMPVLTANKLVETSPGRGGGYRLACPPDSCRVGDVLRLSEGSLAPVACLAKQQNCPNAAACVTLPMWKKFAELANSFFDNITIQDLVDGKLE